MDKIAKRCRNERKLRHRMHCNALGNCTCFVFSHKISSRLDLHPNTQILKFSEMKIFTWLSYNASWLVELEWIHCKKVATFQRCNIHFYLKDGKCDGNLLDLVQTSITQYMKRNIYIYNNTCSVAKLWNGSKVFSYWKVNNVWNPNSYRNQNVQKGSTQAIIFHENVWFNFMFFYQSTVDSTHDKGASVSLYECPTHPIAKVISFFGRKPYRSDLVGSPNITYFVFVYLKI